LKRLALFVLLAGLGVRGVSAQLAYYVDEQGRRVYVNPEPKPDKSAQNHAPDKLAAAAPAKAAVKKRVVTAPVPVANAVPTKMPKTVAAKNSAAPPSYAPLSEVAAASNAAHANLDAMIEQTARRHDVDVNLVRAMVRTESGNNPRAVSTKGALGLMQLMPPTARDLGVTNVFDPAQNVDGGVRYLKSLLTQFGGDLPLSLAAYNAGPGAVERHGGIPPYRETQEYVKKIGNLYGSMRGQAREQHHGIVKTVDDNGRVVYTNLP
jgi:soluble lytic murein transglycosylase-like protein